MGFERVTCGCIDYIFGYGIPARDDIDEKGCLMCCGKDEWTEQLHRVCAAGGW